jgi:hypothetical protein
MMFLEELWQSKGVGRCLQSLRLGPPVNGVLAQQCDVQGGLEDWLLPKLPTLQLLVAWDLANSLPPSQGEWRWQSSAAGAMQGSCLDQ